MALRSLAPIHGCQVVVLERPAVGHPAERSPAVGAAVAVGAAGAVDAVDAVGAVGAASAASAADAAGAAGAVGAVGAASSADHLVATKWAQTEGAPSTPPLAASEKQRFKDQPPSCTFLTSFFFAARGAPGTRRSSATSFPGSVSWDWLLS